jgi:hypothetical protein
MALLDWAAELVQLLETRGVVFAPGLSVAELSAAEERVGCRFPHDLCWFLRTALPTRGSWPNWRDLDSPFIADRLA